MFGRSKPDAWWVHELERQNRAHAVEQAAWATERRELIARICTLAGSYTPSDAAEHAMPPDEISDAYSALDDVESVGDELHHRIWEG